MYETVMHTLRTFFGTGIMRYSLLTAIILIIIVLAASTSSSFRELVTKTRTKKGWKGSYVEIFTGLLKLSIIFVMLRFFITVLNYQAAVFQLEHGRITESNRSAIFMKWGSPHEQRELSVQHKRKRIWVTRQLLLKADKGKDRVYSDYYWKDKKTPVQAVGGKMPLILSAKEETRMVNVPQKSIVKADVVITVVSNPRRLGNANYAGYDDTWKLTYVIANKSKWETTAYMSFRLPAERGLFDKVSVMMDGENVLERTQTLGNTVIWNIPMKTGEEKRISISYSSRGLEHLRYIPARMSQTGHYRVKMNIKGIPPGKLDYPIGSMPPVEKISQLHGDSYTLNWQLDNALTSYDIGMKLPKADQPKYYFADLLREAPTGLILLLIILLLPYLIVGVKVRMDIVVMLSILYCLHYTFMGRLADHMQGFTGPFLLSSLIVASLGFLFRMHGERSSRLLRLQDSIGFAIMVVLYSLAVTNTPRHDFWMQFFYLALVAYICILLVIFRMRERSVHTN